MLLHVAVLEVVACSINVSMTLVQIIRNHLFGLNHSCDLLVLNYYVSGKINWPF